MEVIDLSKYHSKKPKAGILVESEDSILATTPVQVTDGQGINASCIVTGPDKQTYKYETFMVVGNGAQQDECMVCMDIQEMADGLVKLQQMFVSALQQLPLEKAQAILADYQKQLKQMPKGPADEG